MKLGEKSRGHTFFIILALLFIFLALITPTQAHARTEARYLMRAGDTVFGNDLYNSRSIQTLFHQQNLDVSDVEHYNMDFPAFADGLNLGPSVFNDGAVTAPGTTAVGINSANVLPFGLVNLAFPSIQEDSLQTLSATQTGFFASNYNYRPEADFGNVPLSPAYPYALRQAICPAPLFGGLSLYPEQYDTWWVKNRLKELNKTAQAAKPPANQTSANQTASDQTPSNRTMLNEAPSATELTNQTIRAYGIPSGSQMADIRVSEQIKAQDLKQPLAIDYFKSKNASTNPWDMPVVYPSVFNLAGRDGPVFPNPGIGTFSTNGAGSTGASLTGPLPTVKPGKATGNQTGNQTSAGNQTSGNQTSGGRASGNEEPGSLPLVEWASGGHAINQSLGGLASGNQAAESQAGAGNAAGSPTPGPVAQSVKPTVVSPPAGNALTYADFNFDATTEQINQMSILERMWRNSHRGGTMGKAYVGDTSAPDWIDPYPRPYDLSMLDEHFYVLQSALNMVVPGTQIMPRFWSPGII